MTDAPNHGPMFIGFNFDLDEQAFDDLVRKRVYASDQFKPATINIISEYAESIEFGTSPRGGMSHNKRGIKRDAHGRIFSNENLTGIPYSEILAWAERKSRSPYMSKYGLRSESDIKSFAYHVSTRLKKYGMPAQPFIRPAVYNILDRMPDNYFESDTNTIKMLVNEIADEMRNILLMNDTICSGQLLGSIDVTDSIVGDTPYDMSRQRSGERIDAESDRMTRPALNRDYAKAKDIRNKGRKHSVNLYEQRAGLDNKRKTNKRRTWETARKKRSGR